jgi:hypothetical protein
MGPERGALGPYDVICASNPGEGIALPSDLALLGIEIDTLWSSDTRGRLVVSREPDGRAAPLLVVAVSDEGRAVAVGADVPDRIAFELEAAVDRAPSAPPGLPHASIDGCEQLLSSAFGPVQRSSGPSYLAPPGTSFKSATVVHRSTDDDAESLRERNTERTGWSDEDWGSLLDGTFGPWAIATIAGNVIAICHCARLTDQGAEAGVWTDPDFRGRGHAAAVTAAWVSLLAPSGRHVFYSTSADNTSSQRVAARLGLRPIGWLWQLSASP